MDRRHFPNSSRFAADSGRHRNRLAAEDSYFQSGRAVAPETGALVHSMNNNTAGGGYHRTPHPGRVEYPSSSSMQMPQLPRSSSGPSYDPSGAGIVNLTPPTNSRLSHPGNYERYNVNCNPHGHQDSITRNRGELKRKGPESSVIYERASSSSSFYGAGSSSGSFEALRRKPNSNIYYSPSEGPHCGYRSFPHVEDSPRNVRRRTAPDLETNLTPTHVSSYSSHYPHPPNYRGGVNLGNMNGSGSSEHWNFSTMPHATHGGPQNPGTSGFSYGTNQHIVREGGPEIRGYCSDPVSGRDVASSSHYVPAPVQSARWRRNSHATREISPYAAGSNYYSLRREPMSTRDHVQAHPLSYRNSSQSASGWVNSYNNENGLAVERFRSIASIVDAHGRIGSEDLVMDLSTFYASSRNLFDQYMGMRLDIDDMSYEELLALGESIGNVNTGLSDDVISMSLTEEAYCSGKHNGDETCAICLEEYVNEVKLGKVKNCGHHYHAECIMKWLSMKNACPVCKAPVHKDC